MIAPLRRRHRRTLITLALLLPLGLLAAIASRVPPPVQEHLPASLAPLAVPAGLTELHPRAPLALGGRPLRVFANADHLAWIELEPSDEPPPPDTLVLWSPGPPAQGAAPPAGAHFLGTLGDGTRAYPLPASPAPRGGWLLLYSLAHAELVDHVALPAGPPP